MRLPAGTYYIGDPCYVIDKEWDNVCNMSFDKNGQPLNGVMVLNNKEMFIGCTAYGDGLYFDQFGNQYPVDSGCIGVVPVELIDKEDCSNPHFVTFDKPFAIIYNLGKFEIDTLFIDTTESDDDYYDDMYYGESDEEVEDEN
jgi:hypothetical protein